MYKDKEKLIEHYSYYYCDSKDFVEEHLDNYKEMDYILSQVFKNIEEMKKEYNIRLGESGITLENKKTKETYSLNIEF